MEILTKCILDVHQPIAKRTSAAFHLRTLGTLEAALVIGEGKLKCMLEVVNERNEYFLVMI